MSETSFSYKDVHIQLWCPEIDVLVNQALAETTVEIKNEGETLEVLIDGKSYIKVDKANKKIIADSKLDYGQWHAAILQRHLGAVFKQKAEDKIKGALPFARLSGFHFNSMLDGRQLAHHAETHFSLVNSAISDTAWKLTTRIFGSTPNLGQLSWVWARETQIMEIKKKASVLLPFLKTYWGYKNNDTAKIVEENLFSTLKDFLVEKMDLSKAEWRFFVGLKSKDGDYLENKGLKEAGERLKRMCRVGSFAKGSLVTTIVEAFDDRYDSLKADWVKWQNYLDIKEAHQHDPQMFQAKLREINIHYAGQENNYRPRALDPRHPWVEPNIDAVVRAAVEESQTHPDILLFNGQVRLVADWLWNEGISRPFDKSQMKVTRTVQRAVRTPVQVVDDRGNPFLDGDGEPIYRVRAVMGEDGKPLMKTVVETMWPYWVAHSDRWHEEQVKKEAPTDGAKWDSVLDMYFTARGLDKFKDPETNKVPIEFQYMVRPLVNSYDLYIEGKSMHHCVGGGGYTHSCVQGQSRIFTIRRGEMKIATCDLRRRGDGNWYVQQIAGVANAGVNDTVKEIGADLARRYGEAEQRIKREAEKAAAEAQKQIA